MTATPKADPALLEGRAALARGAWEEALLALQAAVAATPGDGTAWESLAFAHTWLQDMDRAIDARQRAYALFREQADDLSAARVSLDLVYDFLEFRGQPEVANGWLQRGRRLLHDRPPAAEHAVLRIWDAYMSLDADPATSEIYAREAVTIADEVGAADVGILALATHGLVLVSLGRVPEGFALLDEAVAGALGREISDPQWYYFACCCMIDACDRVRDFRRSLAWCDQLREFAERWRMQAFLTTCRIKYSAALLWKGDWKAYEDQLEQAIAEMTATKPAGIAGALVRLAELRRRQGRRDDAQAMLDEAGAQPLALPIRAALAMDAGDAQSALDIVETLLRRTTLSARTERVAALELKTRAHIVLGQMEDAQRAAAELQSIADVIDTEPLRASALAAAGAVAASAAQHERARRCFVDAAYLFEKSGSRYEGARIRLDLARCLVDFGRPATAVAEAKAALAVLDAMGAEADARHARALLTRIEALAIADSPSESRNPPVGALTRRQREILALIAQGLSDADIATRIFLSEHTVHRHVANILMRLGASSRTAAVATALRAGMI